MGTLGGDRTSMTEDDPVAWDSSGDGMTVCVVWEFVRSVV